MKLSIATLCLTTALFGILPAAASAQDEVNQALRAAARRDLEIAKIELRLYLQVEYPRQLRQLDAQIKLGAAEVAAYERRRREYRAFDRFSTGGPLLIAGQDLRIRLLEAELCLENLRAERSALVRFHSDQWRLLELRVHEARARVVELEGGGQIELPAPAAAAGG